MWDKSAIAVQDKVCTQAVNLWIFRSFQQRYVRKIFISTLHSCKIPIVYPINKLMILKVIKTG